MKRNKFKSVVGLGLISLSVTLAGCGTGAEESSTANVNANDSLDTIIEKAKTEGEIASVGMPDTWANWVETGDEMEAECWGNANRYRHVQCRRVSQV